MSLKFFNSYKLKLISVTTKLVDYIEKESYAGWDPYDGLNSKIFKNLKLDTFSFFRLFWIQLFKRSPLNLRKLFIVPKGYNSKGLGLMISAYSKLLLARKEKPELLKEIVELEKKIRSLSEILISLISKGYSGACWGYNFDWQARGGLFFKANTPTVVATTYAAYGLFDAYDATGNKRYLDVALDSVNFVLKDLKRDYRQSGSFLFSYSVGFGNNTVYNASLLGSKLLAKAFSYNNNKQLLVVAKGSVDAVIEAQHEDGSWVYGELKIQSWKDSYHTGFNLECLNEYLKYSGDKDVIPAIKKGFDFYIKNFFTKSGIPKYYDNKIYPIDIHSPAQLIATLVNLNKISENKLLVQRVITWTITNMFNNNGYFYYQKKKLYSSKIPYMRWSQAWMMHSLILLNISISEDEEL